MTVDDASFFFTFFRRGTWFIYVKTFFFVHYIFVTSNKKKIALYHNFLLP